MTKSQRKKPQWTSTLNIFVKLEIILTILYSTPIVNAEDYFCNFVIDAEETLDLSDDEVIDIAIQFVSM